MKKLAIVMLAFAASLAAVPNFAGVWNGKGAFENSKYGKVPENCQMTLLQDGTALKGTFKMGNEKPTPFSTGAVSANGLTFSFTSGRTLITATLTQSGAQLTGKMTSSSGQVYDVVFSKY